MRWNILAICLAAVFTNLMVNAAVVGQRSGRSVESLVTEARAAQSKGDFNSAADLYRKAVGIDPSVAELWANLGLMYHELKNPPQAIESLSRAARLKPSLYVPQLFLGIEYLELKQAAQALPHLDRATKMDPSDPQALLALGKALEMLDRPDRAADAYEKATQLTPRDGNAWLKLGTAYLQRVERDARAMTSTYRDSPYYHLRAAETLAEQGKLAQAEKAYEATLTSRSPPPCAHAEFGITLLQENRVAEARRQFDFEANGPQHCELALLGNAVADLIDGHTEVALKEVLSVATNDPAFVRSNLYLFRNAMSRGRAQELLNLARAQGDSDHSSPELASLIEQEILSDETFGAPGFVTAAPQTGFLRTGSNRTGKPSACDQVLKEEIQSLAASQQQLFASCSFYTGDYRNTSRSAELLKASPATKVQGLYWGSKADQKLAVAALSRAGELDPDSSRMHVLIGDVLRQRRLWSEAEAEYRKAAAIDPKSRSARLSLAIVLFTELKLDESFQIDQSLLAEAAEDPEANLLAGEILVQQNELGKAEPYLLKCRNLAGDLAPRLHVLLGKVYAETRRVAGAIDEYKQGLAGDENGSAHYQLGRLYLKAGNKAAAEEAFTESKRLVKEWNSRALAGAEQTDTDASPN